MSVLSRVGAASAPLPPLAFSGGQRLGAAPLAMPATASATSDVVQDCATVRAGAETNWNGGRN